MARDEYATALYKRNRAIILRDQPACAICGGPGANSADHIIPIDAGGDSSLDNLRPAHAKCNSRLGAEYKTKRDQARIQRRNEIESKKHFFDQNEMTPTPILSVSFSSELAVTGGDQPGPAASDGYWPRLETDVSGLNSFGPLVAEWAKRHMGVELMPWQIHALSGQLAHDGTGILAHRESLVSTARQQGKSVALRALIGWWLTMMPEKRGQAQNVLSVANRLDRAESIYNDLAPILKEHFGAKLLQAIGRKSATLPNGSHWEVRAASPRLHGSSNDLIVVDELFDVAEDVLDQALRPSMIARRSPLLSCWSTAGDASSYAMIKMREEGLSLIDSGNRGLLYFAEWSMPPGKDGEEYWHHANPALGTTVTIEALRAAASKDYFRRAHLNQWVAARGAWLDNPATWDLCKTTEAPLPGGVLAVDSSVDESRYVGVRAVQLPDGRTIVHPEFVVDSELSMWAEVRRVMAAPTTQLLITPGLEIHLPVELQRRTNLTGYAELLKHTKLVRSMIVEGRLVHTGETSLAEHVHRAVLVKVGDGVVVSSQKSPGPIELCRCMIWAAAAASRPANKQRPTLMVV